MTRCFVAAFIFLLVAASHAADWQFLFEANGNLQLQSAELNAPPQITGQPQNRVVDAGTAASFFVVAKGSMPLTYQWRFNDLDIGGGNGETLLLPNVSTNNEGQYSVVITNSFGSVTSAPAFLMIDGDHDGMGDSWEIGHFGNLNQNAAGDFDSDGSSNLREFQDGTDPTDSNSFAFRLLVVADAGSVIKTPDQPNYTNGQTVTLTAIAHTNGVFHAWLGAVTTRTNPVTLVMTNDKTVYARFTSIAFTWTSPTSGDWDTATNWTPKLVPGTNDTAIITSGATVTLNTTADCAEVTLGSAASSPTLAGNGTLIVRELFTWASGTMSGSGRTILETGALFTLDNPTQVILDTRTLDIGGETSWVGSGNLMVNNAVITNRVGAVFQDHNSGAIVTLNTGRIENAGTFRKAHSETTTVGVSFNNYGAVEIQTGTLNFAGSSSHTASSSMTGAGHLTFSGGGIVNLAGLVNISGSNTFAGVNGFVPDTVNVTGTYICTNNTLTISGNRVANFSGTGVVSPAVVDLKESGTLTGTGTVTVLNAMNWTGGAMSGSGRTIIPPGVTLNISGASGVTLGGRMLENSGTILWTGTGAFIVGGGGIITNRPGALFHVQNASNLGGGLANGRLDNAGTFRKSANAGTTIFASGMSLNNFGAVEIQAGTLSLGGGGTHSGTFDVPGGTELILSGGIHNANGSSSITGPGNFTVSGGIANLAGLVNLSGSNTFGGVNGFVPDTVNITGNYICTNNTLTIFGNRIANLSAGGVVSPGVLDLKESGTLAGTSIVTVLNTMNWTGGTMSGSGRTIIAAGATLNAAIPNSVDLPGRTLENGGTIIWTGAGFISVRSGAVITNRPGGLFHVQNASGIGGGLANGRLDNAGTFRKSANAGTTAFASGMGFNNYGTVDIRSGILAVNGGYASTVNALLNCALGGTTAGTGYGRLQVSGAVTLDGALGVDLINGFVPATNDVFTVLTAGARNGAFASFSFPSNTVTMQVSNTPNSAVVRVTDVFLVPQPAPIPAGLISWWRAEGNALDSFGTNHGGLSNGTAFAEGKVGQAFAFDGVNDYVQVPDSASLRPGSVTIEAWMKFFATNGIRIALVKPLGSGTFDSYGLAHQDGAMLAAICDNAGFGPFLTGPANTVTGQWYHVAYTFDDSSKQQVLYVNRIPAASGTANKTMSYDSHPLLLGADLENGVLSFFHQGQIDEASIYNRALTGDEIATIYNAGSAGKQFLTPYQLWKQTYLGDPYASDTADPDGDGANNLAEYTADTNPTNSLSNLRIDGVTPVPAGIALQWQGGILATQFLQRSFSPAPGSWQDVFTNPPPTASPFRFTNSAGISDAQFYRIRVAR